MKRYRNSAQIYHIDIKEVEAGGNKKLDPESTVKDIQNWTRAEGPSNKFNPNLKTRISTDASQYAIGGWISQLHAFVSRKLKPAEMNCANPERELLALVLILTRWRNKTITYEVGYRLSVILIVLTSNTFSPWK